MSGELCSREEPSRWQKVLNFFSFWKDDLSVELTPHCTYDEYGDNTGSFSYKKHLDISGNINYSGSNRRNK